MITQPVPDPLQDTPQTTPIRAGPNTEGFTLCAVLTITGISPPAGSSGRVTYVDRSGLSFAIMAGHGSTFLDDKCPLCGFRGEINRLMPRGAGVCVRLRCCVFKRSFRYALVAGAALLVPLVTATAASAAWLAGAAGAAGAAGTTGQAGTVRAAGAAADWRVAASLRAKNQTIQLSDIAAD